ncbi:hypothetical protein INF35_10725 [Subdoligranulum sp. DSM 109015]|uniref:Uncharacterized protein n=1 Tax=Gemmiger gallinarum TaxID=2779354 RepID=A0ABR9R669_9FIRM|nr:hypothetical protein [Gemmiger gallinarum]MBE5038260.1 hypothetical protein [Gemmiger gallinarum]
MEKTESGFLCGSIKNKAAKLYPQSSIRRLAAVLVLYGFCRALVLVCCRCFPAVTFLKVQNRKERWKIHAALYESPTGAVPENKGRGKDH